VLDRQLYHLRLFQRSYMLDAIFKKQTSSGYTYVNINDTRITFWYVLVPQDPNQETYV